MLSKRNFFYSYKNRHLKTSRDLFFVSREHVEVATGINPGFLSV